MIDDELERDFRECLELRQAITVRGRCVPCAIADIERGDQAALDTAARCWQFIKDRLIDHERGEWHWSLMADGTVNRRDDKAGFWKCPYHNGRMCLEMIERFSRDQ